MGWFVASVMAASAVATGVLFARIDRVRIQQPPDPDPSHTRRGADHRTAV